MISVFRILIFVWCFGTFGFLAAQPQASDQARQLVIESVDVLLNRLPNAPKDSTEILLQKALNTSEQVDYVRGMRRAFVGMVVYYRDIGERLA